MVVKNNEFLQEAAQSIYMANADEIVRQQCLAREEAERHERTVERDRKQMLEQIAALKDNIARLQARIAELEAK